MKNDSTLSASVSVLFSEPKIPQSDSGWYSTPKRKVSVLFSEPKIPQCRYCRRFSSAVTVSVLFSEPKIPQCSFTPTRRKSQRVSVLFSEPKIPQSMRCWRIGRRKRQFQCSSASRKFLNGGGCVTASRVSRFQCSSASRKFLNYVDQISVYAALVGFSALQRAENSSIEKTIIQLRHGRYVSVLFSEPKIPQSSRRFLMRGDGTRFQCSSASRKFLNRTSRTRAVELGGRFQCSSASRKFLNPDPRTCVHPYSRLRRSRFVVPEPSWCVAMTPVY